MNYTPREFGFAQIEQLVDSIPHLCGPVQGKWLYDLIQTLPPGDICEVGAYYGYITAILSMSSHRRVYSVDHMIGGMCDYAEGSKCVYREYLDNVMRHPAGKLVIPFPMKTEAALQLFKLMKPTFALVYLDGDHNTEPVFNELVELAPFVPVNGILCGDDCLPMVQEYRPFTELWNWNDKSLFMPEGVGMAVWAFFRDNPEFEVLPSVPGNQFGFRRVK